MTVLVYGASVWLVLWNIYYLFSDQISIFHIVPCLIVAALNYYCLTTIVRYWEMQASEAAEYHLDVLAINTIIALFDPWTHQVW